VIRRSLEPVFVEPLLGPAALAEERLVEQLPAGEPARFAADDLDKRVAEDVGGPPDAAVADAEVDRRQALAGARQPRLLALPYREC
jgi:hypothetical protein